MSEFAARRKQLLDEMGDGVALFPSAPLAVRNHDVEHPYRQDSDLYYLTGLDEPESVLLLTNQHDEHQVVHRYLRAFSCRAACARRSRCL